MLIYGWDVGVRFKRLKRNIGDRMVLFSGPPYDIYLTVHRAMFA